MTDTVNDVDAEFFSLVNLQAAKLENWLLSEESQTVGLDAGDGESIGHKSGKRIVKILRKHRDELTADDRKHMRKVVGYIKRHLAQKPEKEEIEHSRWRASLMSWGHDPLKH
jgi:hypothetical protein